MPSHLRWRVQSLTPPREQHHTFLPALLGSPGQNDGTNGTGVSVLCSWHEWSALRNSPVSCTKRRSNFYNDTLTLTLHDLMSTQLTSSTILMVTMGKVGAPFLRKVLTKGMLVIAQAG